MRLTLAASTLAALLVVASCASGDPATDAGTAPSSEGSSTASAGKPAGGTIPAHTPGVVSGPAGTLDVQVVEPSSRGASAVRYLRVEDATGKKIVEQSYARTPVVLSDAMPTGSYRLITWLRSCSGSCVDAAEKDLAAPSQVCGSSFDVTAEKVTRLVVRASTATQCTVQPG